MKIRIEDHHIDDFSQASFPPFTRGYEAMPIALKFKNEIDKNTIEVLHDFSLNELATLIKNIEKKDTIEILLSTEVITIDFISTIRALRTLLAIIDEQSASLKTRKIHFTLPLSNTPEVAQELWYAQLAQIDTIICTQEDQKTLKLLMAHLPTPPIDALFGNPQLEEKTTTLIEQLYNKIFV